jgi:drug/metabolite transporter (DMT)-like permease
MSQTNQYRNVYGIILMLIHAIALPMLYVINKYVMNELPSSQVVFLYKSAVLIGILPWILHGGFDCIKTNKIGLHLARGLVSTLGALLFMHGLHKVDVASATALNKMEPILLMLLSAIYFKERLNAVKITTLVASFVGMLLVSYQFVNWGENGLYFPWLAENQEEVAFNRYYLYIFAAMLLWTANSTIIKALGKTESNRTQLFYISMISVLVSTPAAFCEFSSNQIGFLSIPQISKITSIYEWNLSAQIMELIMLSALMHFLHVVCYFQSLKVAEMSVVIPFDYSRLIFGAILGYAFFGHIPTFSAYIGYFLILVSGIWLFRCTSKTKQS